MWSLLYVNERITSLSHFSYIYVHARVSGEMQCTVRVMVRTGYSTSKIDEFINVVVICIGMLMV